MTPEQQKRVEVTRLAQVIVSSPRFQDLLDELAERCPYKAGARPMQEFEAHIKSGHMEAAALLRKNLLDVAAETVEIDVKKTAEEFNPGAARFRK